MSSPDVSIGVIYPSRGLLFTETLKEVLEELEPYDYKIYWSHGNKLPACFNKPLSRALRASHTHILFLEDDMIIKKGTLKKLFDADVNIIACDYPIAKCPSGTVLYDKDDNAIFTGTGFMLAKRKVFDGMPRPILRANVAWGFRQVGDKVKFTCEKCDPDKVYGHHDINFGLYQYINDEPIHVSDVILGQRKLVTKGNNADNIGTDKIERWTKYRKINFNMISEDEVKTDGQLIEVKLDSKTTMMSKELAEKLGDKVDKQAGRLYNKNIIIDTEDNKKVFNYFKKEIK